ncbi:hypothetical protein L286_19135 [Sphingobium sp. HDIP04]|nr:hypothetical protein L286_19135 [Sphingobium sp. HDIP04]
MADLRGFRGAPLSRIIALRPLRPMMWSVG